MNAQLTVRDWLAKAVAFLKERGVPEAEANAEFLMAAALGTGRGETRAAGDRGLSENRAGQFWKTVKERAQRVPLAYVLGSQPFLDLDIKVSSWVLIPRPETELLVEAAVGLARELPAPHIIEIGTGSGCVAVALAKRLPAALVYATEISEDALRLARDNAASHGVSMRIRFLREDLFKPGGGAAGWADFVVTNPPYIPTAELPKLQKEVQREPLLALDGGRDGLDAIRAISVEAPRLLKTGGRLLMEFGAGQGPRVERLLRHAGFSEVELRRDLSGRERIAVAKL